MKFGSVAIWKAKRHVRKALHCGSKQQEFAWRDYSITACSRHIYMVLFFTYILFVLNHAFSATPAERLQQHHLLLNKPHQLHVFCVKAAPGTTFTSWSQHNFFVIRKAQAACAESFALWQQATVEFTWQDHSIIACSRHIYMVLFFVHIPFMVDCTFSATPVEKLQQ